MTEPSCTCKGGIIDSRCPYYVRMDDTGGLITAVQQGRWLDTIAYAFAPSRVVRYIEGARK